MARAVAPSSQRSPQDAVNIIIQASNKAAPTLEQVVNQVRLVGVAATEARLQMVALGSAITASVRMGVAELSRLSGAVTLVKQAFGTSIGQTFIQNIRKTADAAASELQPLSKIIGSLARPTSGFLGGLAGGDKEPAVLKQAQGQLKRLQAAQNDAVTTAASDRLDARIQQVSEVIKLLKQTDERFEARMERVAKKTTQIGVGVLQSGLAAAGESRVGDLPILGGMLSRGKIPGLTDALDKTLSDVLVNRFIGKRIPQGLEKVVNQVFGQSLTAKIRQAFETPFVQRVLPERIKTLLGGSLVNTLEVTLRNRLTNGLKAALINSDNLVSQFADRLGTKAAASLLKSGGGAFVKLDNLFGNRLSQTITSTFSRIAPDLVDQSGVVEGVRRTVGELTNLISGSLLTGMTGSSFGGPAGQFLIQLLGDDAAAKVVKQFTGGALVTLGEKLADITFLTKAAETGFTNLFETLGASVTRSALGSLANQLFSGFDKIVPQQLKSAFGMIEKLFPQQVEALKQKFQKQLTGIFDFFTLNKAGRLSNQIQDLEAIATQADKVAEAFDRLADSTTKRLESGELNEKQQRQALRFLEQEGKFTQSQLRQGLEARKRLIDLRKELEQAQISPQDLQQAATQAALDPNLSPDQKGRIIDGLNEQIAQAQRDVQTPLQNFADDINKFLTDKLQIGDGQASGGVQGLVGTLIQGFEQADQYFEGVLSESMGQIGSNAGGSFAKSFGSQAIKGLGPVVNQIDSLISSTVAGLSSIPGKIAQPAGAVADAFGMLSGLNEPLEVFGAVQQGASALTEGLTSISQNIYMMTSGFQALQQLVANGPFELLINQNVRLREQMLATQSTLVSTNQVIQNGQTIVDPTQAIQALEGPVKQAIANVREGSLELVNVTSGELIESFQIIAGQAGAIGISLDEAAELTLSFGASLGTLGVPLAQSRQEIQSILTATVDQNSVVAKSLGITNQMVQRWKAQGTVVDELLKKLEAFRAGNALAAATLGGVTSNIREIFEEIGRRAGEPLLDPIVTELDKLYQFLAANQEQIAAEVSKIALLLFQGVKAGVDAVVSLFNATQSVLVQIPFYLVESLVNALGKLAIAVERTIVVFQPIINVFARLAENAYALGGPFLTIFMQAKAIQFAVSGMSQSFGTLTQVLPGVGDLLFLLNIRNQAIFQSFTFLNGVVGQGAAGFLVLGKHMNAIPGLAGLVTKSLGPLGGIIAPLVPAIAGVGIQVTALGSKFGLLGNGIKKVLDLNPSGLLNLFLKIGGSSKLIQPLIPTLQKVAEQLTIQTKGLGLAEFATEKFAEASKLAGIQLRNFLISTAAAGAALYIAFKLIDQYVLKNEALLETLGGLIEGLKAAGQALTVYFTNPFTVGISVTLAVAAAINFNLLPAILALIKTQLASWSLTAANGLNGLAGAFKAMKAANIAASASEAAIGFQAMSIALSQGDTAAAKFLATNGINVITLQSLKATLWQNVTAAKAFMLSMLTTAKAMMKQFVTSVIAAIAAMKSFRLSTALTGMANLITSLKAGAAGFSLLAAKAKIAAFFTGQAAVSSAAAGTAAAGAGAAATTAAGGFGALATSVGLAIGSLAAFLLPLTAVVGLIAAIGLGVQALRIRDSRQAAEEFGRQTEETSLRAIELSGKLAKARERQNDADQRGVKLKEEEYAENARLQQQAQQQVADIEAEIAERKAALEEAVGKANKSNLETQIAELEARKAQLEGIASNIQIAPKDLVRQGTVYEQLAAKVAGAMEAITNSNGDTEVFKQKGQELIEFTKKQLELGYITTDQAIERFRMLSSNTLADQEIQVTAQQAITEAYKTEGERRVAEAQRQQATTQTLAAQGAIGEAETERQITEGKRAELNARLDAIKENKAEADRELDDALSNLDKEAAKLREELSFAKDEKDRDRILAALKDIAEERVSIIAASTQKGIEKERIYANETVQINQELAQTDAQDRDRANREELKDFDEQQALLNSSRAQGLLNVETFNENQLNIQESRFAEELNQLKEARGRLNATDKEGLEALAVQEAGIYQRRSEARKQFYENQRRDTQEDLQEQLSLVESRRALGNIDQEQFNQQRLQAQETAFDEQLALIRQQRSQLNANDTEGMEALAAQEADIYKQRADARQQFHESQRQAAQEDSQEQITILEGQKALGNVTEESFNQQRLDAQMESFDEQLALIRQRRSQLNANDTEGMEALAAQEADIYKQRVVAVQTFYDEQLRLLERSQKRLLDAVQLSETQTQLDLQNLRNQGLIKQLAMDQKLLEAADERAKTELQIEEEKLAQLEAMPAFADPEAEERRQQQIRDSRQRTVELTLQIAQNEYRRQELIREQLFKELEKEAKKLENKAKEYELLLQGQQLLFDAITASMQRQQQILEMRNRLLSASQNYLQAQLGALKETTRNGKLQQDIAEIVATIQLRTLATRQQNELEILKIQQEQQRLALEREKAENRIAKIQNQADTLLKIAEYRRLAADPDASAEEKEASRLGVVGSVLQGQALQQQDVELQRQGVAQERINQAEMQAKQAEFASEAIGAQMGFVQSLRPGRRRRRAERAVQQDILGDLGFGGSLNSARGGLRRASDSLSNRAIADIVGGVFDASTPRTGGLMPQTPNLPLPPIPNLSGIFTTPQLQNIPNAQDAQMQQLLSDVNGTLQRIGQLSFEQNNQIVNQFTGQDVQNGNLRQQVSEQLLDINYNLMRDVERRQRARTS